MALCCPQKTVTLTESSKEPYGLFTPSDSEPENIL